MTPKKYRILVLVEDSWFEMLIKPLQRLGHEVRAFHIKFPNISAANIESLDSELKSFKPQFCIIQNFYGLQPHPELGTAVEETFAKHQIPVAPWFLDHPQASGSRILQTRWRKGPFPKNFLFFCVDRNHKEFFQMRGLAAEHLPIAVDSSIEKEFFTPSESPEITFVGKPYFKPEGIIRHEEEIPNVFGFQFLNILLYRLQSPPYEMPNHEITSYLWKIQPHFVAFLKKICTQYNDYFKSRSILFEECQRILPGEIYELLQDFIGRIDFTYSYCQLTRYLTHLHRNVGLRVFGGDEWQSFLPQYSEGTPRLSQEQLYSIFSNSKVTFCYTKFQFAGAVHERPVLALACGGFPLTDKKDELYEMFEPDEIASYASIEEAEEFSRYFVKNEDARKKIIEKGRKKVFSAHTFDHRMKTLVAKAALHWNL